jgi:putative hydrolase of the HAD superfamily
MRKQGIAMFDLDDTLVDRESIFVDAQLTMLQTLSTEDPRLSSNEKNFDTLREIDVELVKMNKGVHWYESWKLAQALWLHLHEEKNKQEAISIAFNQKESALRNPLIVEAAKRHDGILADGIPRLRDNAIDILKELHETFVLILVSCGKEKSQMKIVRHHKLDKIFDSVIICEVKNVDNFLKAKKLGEEILLKNGGEAKRFVMVGDRISQDVCPAKAAGLETIWIPGQYDPGDPRKCPPDHQIKSLVELRKILLTDKI